jgi:hypothetical protein
VFPQPTRDDPKKLWIRVGFNPDPMNPGAYSDGTLHGVSNLSNVPYGNLQYDRINSMGRQWTRQFCVALCKELLGQIRSKFGSIPIPGGDLQLNGADLLGQGKEEQEALKTELKEMLETLTYSAMLEDEANASDNLMRILKNIPVPNGKAIVMG